MKYFKLKATLILAILLCNISASAYTEIWQNNIKYTLGDDGTAAVNGISRITAAIIPEKVTYDGIEYAVTSIKEYAFAFCSNLASVAIPSSVTSIGDQAFYNCSSLASVVIPSSVTYIGDQAFCNCSSLASVVIPSSVTSIGSNAFSGCSSLASVVIPSSVTSIGKYAFSGCSSLLAYRLNSDYTAYVYDVGDSIKTANIPEKITYEGNDYTVTSIENYTFSGCSSLASVVIPSSVTSIGSNAFSGCSSLYSVTVGSGVQSIAASAFTDFNGYIQPEKVIWLGNTPPEGYEYVEGRYNYVSNGSFAGLSNTKVYPFLSSMFEKDGIKYVPVNPSERTCDAIDCEYDSTAANISIEETVNYKGVELAVKDIRPCTCYGNKYVKSVKVDYGGAIGNSAFYACYSVASVDIAATKIGSMAFYDCGAMTIAKINADTIGSSAFYGNSAVTEAKITAKTIGASAFENSATKNPAKFEVKADNIGDNAFTGCSKLEGVVLGESLKSVGNSAFEDCASLKGITIPDSVTSIGGRCFQGCKSLAYAKIGTVVSVIIHDEAFSNCKSLPEIIIPKTVERIGNNVFAGCYALADVTIADRETELKLGSNGSNPMFSSCPLKSVYIGGNITYGTTANDGYSPFYRNTSLETVRITDRETEISENEFYGCTSLKSVSMGDDIETIGRYAFSGCSALESFSFGTGLKSIGDEAFSDCTGMKKLVSKTAVPPVCGTQALDDINKWECTLYVPQESLDAYKSAAQWKEFFFLETGIKNVPNTSSSATESARYSTDGTRIASPQKGINIIRMSDGTVKKVLVK